jgi:hypothetical protein
MKKLFIFLLLFLILAYVFPVTCLATNNIFGLHLTQSSDLTLAQTIINSSGGDWGWVTIVLPTNQLNRQAWQEFFDNCRRLHLIPIIRLAATTKKDYWQRPTNAEIDQLASFLDSLNWPTQKRHLILFNEINHGQEWGGEVDIANFTQTAIYTAKKFKQLSPDFFILGPGLDLAAPENPPQYKSAFNVLSEIYKNNPEYFSLIDGWSSHSYPNHGFIGKPSDNTDHSIRGYAWELEYLKQLGVTKNYPVFITETGWPHREGQNSDDRFYTLKTASEFLHQAFDQWQQDSRIVAVTPFIFNYPYPPFDHFSWLNAANELYPEYRQFLSFPKSKNQVAQLTRFQYLDIRLPLIALPNQEYVGYLLLKNTGQSIWGETNFCLKNQSSPNLNISQVCTDSRRIEPGQIHPFQFRFKINSSSQDSSFLAWENIPKFEIEPILSRPLLYHPSKGLRRRLYNFIQTLLI